MGNVAVLKSTYPRLARTIKRCQDLPGQHLFQYLDDDGTAHPIGSADEVRKRPNGLMIEKRRVPLGVAWTGGIGYHSSGDIFLAFSTANATAAAGASGPAPRPAPAPGQ